MITSKELRKKYIEFFVKKGHKEIASASLIPENDASVLFTTAGMQPLVPYLLGEKHPQGDKLCNTQKCVRTGDIDEVGDDIHCTFFEMLGNWSLGAYFKEESIKYSYEFLTDVLGIDKKLIAVTVFKGDEDAPRDEIVAKTWQDLGISKSKIFFLGKENNWWWAGDTGPCGSDTEIFIDTLIKVDKDQDNPKFDNGKYVEIWNNVFMEYYKNQDGTYSMLKQKNVDTGMGLERMLCFLQNVKSVYETDLFTSAMEYIKKASSKSSLDKDAKTKAQRIIADHTRTATFLLGDKNPTIPSNTDRGYVVRRLIRRAVRYAMLLDISPLSLVDISEIFIEKYQDVYKELIEKRDFIKEELAKEIAKFEKTLENGLKEMEKVLKYATNNTLNGKTAFRLYDTYGFPLEMTKEIASEKGFIVDVDGYYKAQKEHQEKSKAGAEQKFKGGIASTSEMTTKLHTATHLLLAALKSVLSNDIKQRGSNITEERLRFDFNFERPMTQDEIKQVEAFVNDAISKKIDVVCKEYKLEEAQKMGAEGSFASRYEDVVKVYTINGVSMEICGGPHVKNTGDLGKFVIQKEQSSSAGVRRIRATLTN